MQILSVLLSWFNHIQIGALIWPFLQAVNFTFIPGRLRAIYVAIFSFFWTTGLAALKHSDHSPGEFVNHVASDDQPKWPVLHYSSQIKYFQTGVCIWTFLTAINFKLVPGRFRTIFVGFCGFFWFTFLAYLKHSDNKWESPVLRLINRLSEKPVAP